MTKIDVVCPRCSETKRVIWNGHFSSVAQLYCCKHCQKTFNGLGERVQHAFEENLFSGHLFIFRGRRGDMVKILWADGYGLCLFTKRLEEGRFVWPMVHDGKIAITRSQLAMLLDKLDWRQPNPPL